MPKPLDHTIFNEKAESQDKLIELLKAMGYEYVSRSEAEKKRGMLSKVVFEDELTKYLRKQTYKFNNIEYPFSADSITKAVNAIDVPLLQGLMSASKEIYDLLTLGISLEQNIPIDGEAPFKQSFDLNYLDFENPENNIWQVTEEFSVERISGEYARPDIVIMVNGLPLVVIECKKSSVDVIEGVKQQCRNMHPDYIQQLFKFTQIVMAVNPNKVLYATAGTTQEYFAEWKEEETNANLQTEQDRTVSSMLDKKRLLDLIKNFILYDSGIKKICRHQQYFAVNKTIDRISGKDNSDSKGGVIWHTQGSGKSLTMVMLVKKLQTVKANENPRFLIVTDRVNLDKQIRDNFAHTQMKPARAATGNGLKALLEDSGNMIITTLINKFENAVKSRFVCPDSDNMYVLIDEAHRSQYSSLYNYMIEVIPNATMIAFTGTPLVAERKKNTYKKFGAPIHNYTMKRAIEDNIVVPLVYEGRKVKLNDPKDTIDTYFESLTKDLLPEQKKELKEKFSKYKQIAETSCRLNLLAFDIHDHFINYCKPQGLKAMIVCSSRAAAVEMYEILTASFKDIRPAVVITFDSKNEGDDDDTSNTALEKINNYHKKVVNLRFGNNDAKYEDSTCNRFKDSEDDLDILIVKDKLLTGFDAPIAGVLYLDKSVKEHSLLQAIARVNRVYPGKEMGLIVDYHGVFTKLNAAMEMYNDAESGFNQFDKEDLEQTIFGPIDEKNKLKVAHEKLSALFEKLENNKDSNACQLYLKNDESGDKRRKEFYQALKEFAVLLNLALSNRTIFVEVGLNQIELYKKDYLFYKKLKDAVMLRYDDNSGDLSKYESGIRNLLNTFITGDEIKTVVEPVLIDDEMAMRKMLDKMETNDARADAIRTRIEAKLKQVRYDDPLLFENFSKKIKKTLEEYEQQRDADKYLADMERIKDDFKLGLTSHDYPAFIANDSDAKAFYGAIYINLKKIATPESHEEIIGSAAKEIKQMIIDNTKRDWKNNLTVHKQIHRILDDRLFDLYEKIGIDINDGKVIENIDLIIDEMMKVAIVRF